MKICQYQCSKIGDQLSHFLKREESRILRIDRCHSDHSVYLRQCRDQFGFRASRAKYIKIQLLVSLMFWLPNTDEPFSSWRANINSTANSSRNRTLDIPSSGRARTVRETNRTKASTLDHTNRSGIRSGTTSKVLFPLI